MLLGHWILRHGVWVALGRETLPANPARPAVDPPAYSDDSLDVAPPVESLLHCHDHLLNFVHGVMVAWGCAPLPDPNVQPLTRGFSEELRPEKGA